MAKHEMDWSEYMTPEVVEEIVYNKLKKEDYNQERWTVKSYEYVTKGRFTFIVMYIKIPRMGGRMHRYAIMAYSAFTKIYEDSNVIDANKGYTLDEVEAKTKAYFSYVNKLLNKL